MAGLDLMDQIKLMVQEEETSLEKQKDCFKYTTW